MREYEKSGTARQRTPGESCKSPVECKIMLRPRTTRARILYVRVCEKLGRVAREVGPDMSSFNLRVALFGNADAILRSDTVGGHHYPIFNAERIMLT